MLQCIGSVLRDTGRIFIEWMRVGECEKGPVLLSSDSVVFCDLDRDGRWPMRRRKQQRAPSGKGKVVFFHASDQITYLALSETSQQSGTARPSAEPCLSTKRRPIPLHRRFLIRCSFVSSLFPLFSHRHNHRPSVMRASANSVQPFSSRGQSIFGSYHTIPSFPLVPVNPQKGPDVDIVKDSQRRVPIRQDSTQRCSSDKRRDACTLPPSVPSSQS